jgi:DNA-binding MarR family transcriptional regulator
METASAADSDLALRVVGGLEQLIGLFRTLSAPNELSLTAVATMATLQRTGQVRLTWLAANEGVTQPGMTQLVSRLEAAGLVERIADPADRRVVLIRITAAGLAALTERRAARADKLIGMLARLSQADRAALAAALPAIGRLTRQHPETEH